MTIDNLEHTIEYMKHLSEDLESNLDVKWTDFVAIVSSLSGYEELAGFFHESGIGFTFITEDDNYKPVPQQIIDYINHNEPVTQDVTEGEGCLCISLMADANCPKHGEQSNK
jgi:hypothetical protein